MPWKETGPVLERTKFIEDYLSGFYKISELAERYGVSRRVLHKWLSRHDRDGIAGLADRSRAPLHIPHRTSEEMADDIVAFRRRFPHMGPRKIAIRLAELHPDINWPAASTIGDILRRANLVQLSSAPQPTRAPAPRACRPTKPNDLMTVDYKGQFLLSSHRYCYPLTIVDHVSRYILACDGFFIDAAGTYPSCVRTSVPRVRTAASDPLGQRQSVRISRSGQALPTFAVVDPAWHQRRADRPGSSRAERSARADASHAEGRDGATTGVHVPATAAALRPVSRALPETSGEIAEIAPLYAESRVIDPATYSAVRNAATDVVHIAGHTESLYGSDTSVLRFADERVTPGTIAAAPLARNPIVVLSACETLRDLGGAFVAAGAQDVVGTLTPIADAVAREIFSPFAIDWRAPSRRRRPSAPCSSTRSAAAARRHGRRSPY